jgi:hypothetical protein
VPEPRRQEIAAAEHADHQPADDSNTVRFLFDAFDAWAANRAPSAAQFGPADGAVQAVSPSSPFTVRVHAATQEWLIHDGLLRRVRTRAGQTLRVSLGESVDSPQRSNNDDLGSDIALPSPVAAAPFRERPDWLEPGQVAIVGRPNSDAPVYRLGVELLTAERAFAKEGAVFVTDRATGQVTAAFRKGRTLEVRKLAAGTYTVQAAGPDGRAERVVEVRGETTIQLVLQRGPEVRGRVVDRDGAPVPRCRIVWTAGDEYRNHELTDDDGTFVVRDVCGAVGTVWACVPGKKSQLPAVGRVVGPGEPVELVLDKQLCRGSLQVRVAVPDGVLPRDVSVRLWQQESGLGVRLVQRKTDEGAAQLGRDDIPAGHYRLEIHCPRFGAIDAGPPWLDGTGAVALDLALPPAAHVTFTLPPDAPHPAAYAFDLVRVGAAVDIVIPTGSAFAGPHLLGPGRYAVWWRGALGTRSHEFAVATAGATTIELPR